MHTLPQRAICFPIVFLRVRRAIIFLPCFCAIRLPLVMRMTQYNFFCFLFVRQHEFSCAPLQITRQDCLYHCYLCFGQCGALHIRSELPRLLPPTQIHVAVFFFRQFSLRINNNLCAYPCEKNNRPHKQHHQNLNKSHSYISPQIHYNSFSQKYQ